MILSTSGKPALSDLTVAIEASHIYTHQTLGELHKIGAEIGAYFSGLLMQAGASVQQYAFIDNYNPAHDGLEDVLDEEGYISVLSEHGFVVDKKQYEADLVQAGKDVIAELSTYESDGVLYWRSTALQDLETERITCGVLDAASYMERLREADHCVSVLDVSFRRQQKTTKNILKQLNVDTSKLHAIYHTKKGFGQVATSAQATEPIAAILLAGQFLYEANIQVGGLEYA